MNYYRRYTADYLAKTVGLSMAEDGAYNRLLDWYYANEKPLPAEPDRVFAIARARTKTEKDAVKSVLETMFELNHDGYHNSRADFELSKAVPRIENIRKAAIENGKKGGRPKQSTTKSGTESGSKSKPNPGTEKNPVGNQPLSSRENLSVATQPADERPSDPIEVIFQIGLPILTSAGLSEKGARSLLGKLRKDHGPLEVAAAVRRMAAERPAEPAAWITAALGKPAQRMQAQAKSAAEWARELLPERQPHGTDRDIDGTSERLD